MKKSFILVLMLLASLLQAFAQEKPIIGISCNATGSAANFSYIDAVEKVGGIPVIIPRIDNEDDLLRIVKGIDGLLLIGGEDIAPALYGEEEIPENGEVVPWRDDYDIRLAHMAFNHNKAILGICRGIQAINVAFGGSLYQDLPIQYEGLTESHRQKEPAAVGTHKIVIREGSSLAEILTEKEYMVNSFHHQAVKVPAKHFEIDAWSPEGVIESISYTDGIHKTVRGVQFHPELMIGTSDALLPLFTDFIREAARVAE